MAEPPSTLDGAHVLSVANLSDARATGTVRLFRHGEFQDSNDFAFLALAAYDGDTGCYVFYCDDAWEVQNDMLYDSRQDAEEQVRREFHGIAFTDL
jgi:hypothetical protein